MGLSATPNAAVKDLGAMLSAGNAPAARASAASSGADTFGNLLSDRVTQEAERRRATAQSAADDAGRRADIARKDAARANAARDDQDAGPVERTPGAQVETTPASSTANVPNAKPAAAEDLDTAAQQTVVDPAAQLAAQIEAARQAAQQAAAAQVPALPTAAPSASDAHADAMTQPAGKPATNDAATLAALNAAATNTQGADTDAAASQAAAQAPNDASANATAVSNAPTAPTAALPDGHALAQTLARTRAVGDNTPPGVRQLGSTSQAQNAGAEHGLPRRSDASAHGAAGSTAASVADVTNRTGGNGTGADSAGTQADTSGAGAQFEGILTRAHGDASAAAPTFAVGGVGATGAAAAASITPAQAHALPTFGDAAWPHTMASQLAFMQVHRQSSAELQLNPAELGGLHVKLEVDNGAVNASFVCQHQAVAELVQDAMPRLRDAMHQGGMQLAQTSVSTGDFSQQQGASQGSSAQGNGSGNGGNGSRFGSGATPERSDTVATVPRRASAHDGAIDTFA